MTKIKLKKLVLSAMFLALGLVLPFLTGQIPEIGKTLLPMHIPVLLCGMICGWQYGLTVGGVTPILRSLIFSQPILYPTAVAMAFELATYGIVAALLYRAFKKNLPLSLYGSLIGAMLAGRIVLGIANTILFAINGNTYTFALFLAGAFTNALPGIAVQLILIPATMLALWQTKLAPIEK